MPHITSAKPHEVLLTALRAELAPSQLALKAAQDELLVSQARLQAAVQGLSARMSASQNTSEADGTLKSQLAASQDILHSAEVELTASLSLLQSARAELATSQSKLRVAEDELERMRNAGHDDLAARTSDEQADPDDDATLDREFHANLEEQIRTPLNAVLQWSRRLKEGQASNESLVEALHVLARVAQSQATLIEELLDLRRLVQRTTRVDQQSANLAAVLRAAMQSIDAHKPVASSGT